MVNSNIIKRNNFKVFDLSYFFCDLRLRNLVSNFEIILIFFFSFRFPFCLKVFPYEYQRALKLKEEEAATVVEKTQEKTPNILDIEESVKDSTMEKIKLEKALDKTR